MAGEPSSPHPRPSEFFHFLEALAHDGSPAVGLLPPPANDPQAQLLLTAIADRATQDLGLPAPPFRLPAAEWAARLFYQLCQFVMVRDLDATQISAVVDTPCPAPRDPATDWSVDPTFRHLPRLLQITRHVRFAEPLVVHLIRIAREWPLSTVGMPDLTPNPSSTNGSSPTRFAIDSFIHHPTLRRLYVDRILATSDSSRLGDARVDDLIRTDLGLHPGLAPRIASQLSPSHTILP
jgi:hypothetical protein